MILQPAVLVHVEHVDQPRGVALLNGGDSGDVVEVGFEVGDTAAGHIAVMGSGDATSVGIARVRTPILRAGDDGAADPLNIEVRDAHRPSLARGR